MRTWSLRMSRMLLHELDRLEWRDIAARRPRSPLRQTLTRSDFTLDHRRIFTSRITSRQGLLHLDPLFLQEQSGAASSAADLL